MPTGRRSRIGRPSWMSRAASPPRAARGGALRGVGARNRPAPRGVALAGGFLEPAAEFAREFLEGAALAGLSAGGSSAGGGASGTTLVAAVSASLGRRGARGCARRCSSAARRSTSRQMPKPR